MSNFESIEVIIHIIWYWTLLFSQYSPFIPSSNHSIKHEWFSLLSHFEILVDKALLKFNLEMWITIIQNGSNKKTFSTNNHPLIKLLISVCLQTCYHRYTGLSSKPILQFIFSSLTELFNIVDTLSKNSWELDTVVTSTSLNSGSQGNSKDGLYICNNRDRNE